MVKQALLRSLILLHRWSALCQKRTCQMTLPLLSGFQWMIPWPVDNIEHYLQVHSS
jgi:hypothetical protein